MKRTGILLTTAFLTCSFFTATTAFAAGEALSATQRTITNSQFSDKQLQDFASASQKITSISADYNARLQSAKSDVTQQQQIREEADQKMLQSIKESNLTVDEFNQIGQAIQKDPQLLQRVASMVQNTKIQSAK